jgi:hypothetical protein
MARSSAFFGGVGRTALAAWVRAAFAWLTAGAGLLGPFIIASAAFLSAWRACLRARRKFKALFALALNADRYHDARPSEQRFIFNLCLFLAYQVPGSRERLDRRAQGRRRPDTLIAQLG